MPVRIRYTVRRSIASKPKSAANDQDLLLKYFLYKKTQLKKVNKTVAEKENGDREVYINKSGDGAKNFSL